MYGRRTRELQLAHELEVRVEVHDALADRHVLDHRLARRLLPFEVLQVGALDPRGQELERERPRLAALDGGVADVVLHPERARVDVTQQLVEIPK